MGVLLAIALIAYVFTRAISDARVDHTLAKKGIISPRLTRRYGGEKPAREKTHRYGLSDFLLDAWSDHWQRRAAALQADRDQPVGTPRGQRKSLKDRFRAATALMRKLGENPQQQRSEDANVTEPTVREKPAEVKPEPATPEPVAEPEPTLKVEEPEKKEKEEKPAMTAPAMTAEVVNYETALQVLEALAERQRICLENTELALQRIEEVKSAIGDVQETYRDASGASVTVFDQLEELHLDGTTLSLVGTSAESMPASTLEVLFNQVEVVAVDVENRKREIGTAWESTTAAIANLTPTYGEAVETVAANLGGDSRFVASS